jgi:hypothetical protein
LSKVVAERTYLIATQLGNMLVKNQLVTEYDVEDIVREQAISQARLIHMLNISKEIDANAMLPKESLPTIFKNSEEELSDG